MDPKFTRRDFICKGSLALAGALAYTTLSPIVGFSERALAFLEKKRVPGPAVGEPFRDPPEMINRSRQAGVFEATMQIKMASVIIGSRKTRVFAYNGLFPSETIRLRRGDILRLRLENHLPDTDEKTLFGKRRHITNLHTHGWHVSPSGNSDNIFLRLKPGHAFQHEYDTSLHEPGTMSFYHAHYHHLVAEQVWRGLSGGVLILEDEVRALSDFETHVMILRDMSIADGEPEPYTIKDYVKGKEGGINMVNGQVNPLLKIRPGQVQRWRILNSATARYYKISLEGLKFYLVGTDGGLLDRPYPMDSLLLTPGERADILVRGPEREGLYRFVSLPYDRRANRPEKITLLSLESSGRPVSDRLPSAVNPGAKRLDLDLKHLQRKTIRLYMPGNSPEGYINMKDFNKDPYVLRSRTGTYEVWDVVNISPMDHPFHQHTNPALVLGVWGRGAEEVAPYTKMPAWKDTVNIPYLGRVRLLVPVKDFPGRTVFHCHILEHEVNGMMGVWEMS